MTTIAEVAERAGVGVGTVSRVLNGSPAVAAPTRTRVLAVIDELGYEPNAAARALSTGHSRTLGVLAPFFTQPSVVERLRGISRLVANAGYQLVLFDVEHPESFAELSAGGRLDGLLCVSLCPSEAEIERFKASKVPVVLVDCEHPRLPWVAIDDIDGGRLAVQHLVGLGHRRIAYVGDEEDAGFGFTSSARRRMGAATACRDAGLDLVVRRGPHSRGAARGLAIELLAQDDRPTAIFAASDTQALGVLEAADSAGLPVPGEVSVMGFDDIEVAHYIGLTTIAQPLEESGTSGARLLLDALEGVPRSSERLDLRLVVRATTAPPPAAGRRPASTNRPGRLDETQVSG